MTDSLNIIFDNFGNWSQRSNSVIYIFHKGNIWVLSSSQVQINV